MDNIIPLVREDPLALYFSAGWTWPNRLGNLIANDRLACKGLRIDPAYWGRQAALVDAANAVEIETVLDPRSLELSTEEGRERSGVTSLPWAGSAPHDEILKSGDARSEVVGRLAEFVLANKLSGVLAPTHYIRTVGDEWLDIDDVLVTDLRRALDQQGGRDIVMYRPVYLHADVARDGQEIQRLCTRIQAAPADGLWLAVHPFGTANSGTVALRRYVELCRALQQTNLPLVGMHTGTVGLTLMALGALGGIESGITDGETFDIDQRLRRPRVRPDGKSMGPVTRVYVPTLQAFLKPKEAEAFFKARGMTGQHVCQRRCCLRGVQDMVSGRVEHFIESRSSEVNRLSDYPRHRRAEMYLDETLRPASDRAVAASRALPSMGNVRKRLDTWRQAYTATLDREGGEIHSVAQAPTGRRLRARRAG